MILFLGDSFTWGQGLHYYYLVENEGWTWDDCEQYLTNVKHFESLGFKPDEYRKQNNFPYLVGKELNLPIITPRAENGGDNYEIYKVSKNTDLFVTNTNIDYVIVQFSAGGRSLVHGSDENPHDSIDKFLEHEIDRIAYELNKKNLKWYGISWFIEHGQIMKEKYPNNHIPILYKGEEFDAFEFEKQPELRNLIIQYTQNIPDGHFNLEGHRVIADSIITKIKEN